MVVVLGSLWRATLVCGAPEARYALSDNPIGVSNLTLDSDLTLNERGGQMTVAKGLS